MTPLNLPLHVTATAMPSPTDMVHFGLQTTSLTYVDGPHTWYCKTVCILAQHSRDTHERRLPGAFHTGIMTEAMARRCNPHHQELATEEAQCDAEDRKQRSMIAGIRSALPLRQRRTRNMDTAKWLVHRSLLGLRPMVLRLRAPYELLSAFRVASEADVIPSRTPLWTCNCHGFADFDPFRR